MTRGKEKRRKVVSVRVSEEQMQRIEENAKDKGMTVSSYMAYMAANGNDVSPEMLIKVQNIVNCAVHAEEELSVDEKIYLEKEVDELWKLLKF